MSQPNKKQRTASKPFADPKITDPRFSNIQSDPRYRLPGKKNKVKLDKRFSRVLQDEDFTKRAKVDRYGRPIKQDLEQNRLKRKFEFAEDDEEGVDEHDRVGDQQPTQAQDPLSSDDEPDDDEQVQKELSRFSSSATRDILRQGLDSDTSSTSSDSSDEDSDLDDETHADLANGVGLGAAQQSDIPMGDVTSRIAVVNLDWDNIRATDLMAVFTSFLHSTGAKLLKVSIYPSEFGKERLEREEMEGPPREIFASSSKDNQDSSSGDEDEDDQDKEGEEIKATLLKPDDGAEFDSAALRTYQLERLRYYYAILTFSSPNAAKHIYDAIDGTEYLTTANFFDLRFVPDDTNFDDDTPREECERIPDDYRPNEFVTDALQHSKVKLTWDAEDGGRKETIARAFRGGRQEIDENDLKAYLASDSSASEDEDDQDNQTATQNEGLSKKEIERQKMRTLLGLAPEPVKASKKDKSAKTPVGDMQITFTSGFSTTAESGKKRNVFENSPEPDETTMEKYIRKEKERKAKRKEKYRATKGGEHDTGDQDDKPQPSETANEGEEDLGFDDPFFSTADANSASAAKSASSKLRKEERLKKRREREAEEENERKQRAELELLMTDDTTTKTKTKDGANVRIRHFDMKEIEKAEKQEKKRSKQKNHKKKSKDDDDAEPSSVPDNERDDFKVDTADPRFARLFDSHEYAIDPTNPRFKGTKAMKEVLDEGRRRKAKKARERGHDDDDNNDRRDLDATAADKKKEKKKDKKNKPSSAPTDTADVKTLVEKIKSRTR